MNLFLINQIKAPKGDNIAYRLYEKSNKKNPCFAVKFAKMGNLIERDLNKIFLVVPDVDQIYSSRIIQTFIRMDAFISDYQLFETLRAFVIRKDLKKQSKDFMNKWFVLS